MPKYEVKSTSAFTSEPSTAHGFQTPALLLPGPLQVSALRLAHVLPSPSKAFGFCTCVQLEHSRCSSAVRYQLFSIEQLIITLEHKRIWRDS